MRIGDGTQRVRPGACGGVALLLFWALDAALLTRQFGVVHRPLVTAIALPIAVLQTGIALLTVKGAMSLFGGHGGPGRPGTLVRRCFAAALDVALCYCSAVPVALLLAAWIPAKGAASAALAAGAAFMLLKDATRRAASPGKRLLKLCLVNRKRSRFSTSAILNAPLTLWLASLGLLHHEALHQVVALQLLHGMLTGLLLVHGVQIVRTGEGTLDAISRVEVARRRSR